MATQREVIMQARVFGREVKVVANFGFKVGVARYKPNAGHVEVVIFLFECGRTETHAVAQAQV